MAAASSRVFLVLLLSADMDFRAGQDVSSVQQRRFWQRSGYNQ